MSKIIVAKKYVKALLDRFNIKKFVEARENLEQIYDGFNVNKEHARVLLESQTWEIVKICENLEQICDGFKVEKFKHIICSPNISKEEKSKFLLTFINIKYPSETFSNFIKLISENNRLEILPEILISLKSEISKINNEYKGFVYSKKEITRDQIIELEKSFSNRFNSKIDLVFIQNDYNGIKVDLGDLGVEISFSIDRLKEKMSEYILKAI